MSEEIKNIQEELNEQMQIRRDKLAEYEADGIYPFGQRFVVKDYAKDIKEDFFLKYDGQPVVIAGRLMTIRSHGKTAFANIRDKSGDIQVYFRKDVLGEEAYKYVKMLDIGDIIGVEGHVFKTHTGEVTIKVNKLTLLSKSLRPLPEKWHGLKDTELRYRQRYVDLIVNPEVRDTFVKRSQIVAKIREYMMRDGFMEVETPMMHAIPGGAAARPFITHHNALDIDIYMRIAPELYLKRLIVGGMDRVFEMNRCFRNEGIDNRHNPEFTTIESYQAYGDVEDAIRLTENLVSYCAQEVLGTQEITYQGTEINLTPPWNRITMAEGVKKYTGEDFDAVTTIEEARAIADRLNVEYTENDGIGKILNLCFEDYVEEYIKNCENGEFGKNKVIDEVENDIFSKEKEFMLIGLRKIEGVLIQDFKNKFGENPIFVFKDELKKLVDENLLIVDFDRIKLTNKGLDLANIVWKNFV